MPSSNYNKGIALHYFLIGVLCALCSCIATQQNTPYKPEKDKEPAVLDFQKESEDEEYDLVVFDPQFDVFLQTRAMPKNFYSESFYKHRNRLFVLNWNNRVMSASSRSDIYETLINYDWSVEYGLNLEYKLFNFFVFTEWKHNVDIDGMANRFVQ